MLVSEIISSDAQAEALQATQRDDLGRDDFLRMLIAQLEHQDPLDPQQATEMTAQLAQFSSLEQLLSMRQSLEEMTRVQTDAQNLSASVLIGREVLAESAHFELAGDGAPPALSFDLAGSTTATTVEMLDARQRVIASFDLGPSAAGETALSWNGTDATGNPLPAGIYSFRVNAVSGADPVSAMTLVRTRVTGVALSGDEPSLMLGSVSVPLSTVRAVSDLADAREGVTP